MSKLIELAERCEQATGPDRELDAEIACVAPICTADYVMSARPSERRGMVTRYFDGGSHGTFLADRYTASLDAAMTLVPKGYEFILYSDGSAEVGRTPPPGMMLDAVAQSDATTPALALCAAALRARASLDIDVGENG